MNDQSPPSLSEMIAAQYAALSAARAVHGPASRTVAAQEATLQKLLAEARVKGSTDVAFARARALAELPDPEGRLDALLRPFHAEALRPQIEFNRALVDVLRAVLGAPASDRGWARRRLSVLADPTAWRVKSHRNELSGQLVDLTKKAYLKAQGPTLERVLAQQREWNARVIDAIVGGGRSNLPSVAEDEPLLRGQGAFNRHVAKLLAEAPTAPTYAQWVDAREKAAPRDEGRATFSIVLTGEGDRTATLQSLRAQTSPRWKLDAPGTDWVLFLEAGCRLAPHALAAVERFATSQMSAVYADEDRLDSRGERSEPYFKPDLSPELLASCDLLARALFVRSQHAKSRPDAWSLPGEIGHLPEVLVTTGHRPGPRADDFLSDEGLTALQRRFPSATRTPRGYRVKHPLIGRPLVSIIVPFKDKPQLLKTLVDSLRTSTAYEKWELIFVSNNSIEPETHALLATLKGPQFKHVTWNHPFHYPKLNNAGAREASGELLLFLNNDIEAFEPGWLDELVSQAQRADVGAVGARLLFPDRTIQHAGVVIGLGGFAGHVFAGLADDTTWTPFGHAGWGRDCLAVTSACVMLRRETFDAMGGFDERFVVCGSDVDLCLRIRAAGKRVIYTPHAALIHHESASRRNDAIPPEDFWESLRAYQPYLAGDPFYSPRLSLQTTVPGIRPEHEPAAIDVAMQQLTSADRIGEARIAQVRRAQAKARTLEPGPTRKRVPTMQPPKQITWFLPYFDHPFGGIHTVLRFADAWQRMHGVENQLVVYDNPHVTARELEARVAPIFEKAPGTFTVLKSPDDVAQLPEADVGIATLWDGAYLLDQHPRISHRAYFVQDYEPAFYAAGTLSALASHTYDLGLFGLFNTRGLHDYVKANHPMVGAWFEPAVDHSVFHARGRREGQSPVRVFFYGRPSIDRNGFELGLEALRRLKNQLKDGVEIVSAGEAWDPQTFDAAGVIENLGVLPFAETANLYRSVDIGLVFMFTRHPSYLPLELMACGTVVVTNQNSANEWLFAHGGNALLAQPTAKSVAAQLIEAAQNPALREKLSKAGQHRMAAAKWEDQTEKMWNALARWTRGG